MAARIDDDYMTAEFGGRVIATARYSSHAAADGQGRVDRIRGSPRRLFTRNQAITAMVLAERLAALATATMTCSSSAGVRSWACDRPAHQDHHGARGGGRGPGRRGHLVRQHAFELVRSHGEYGVTARLLPFTVDGLIWAASMLSGVCRGVV